MRTRDLVSGAKLHWACKESLRRQRKYNLVAAQTSAGFCVRPDGEVVQIMVVAIPRDPKGRPLPERERKGRK